MKTSIIVSAIILSLTASTAWAEAHNIGGGVDGGTYNEIAQRYANQIKLQSKGKLNPQVFESNGTIENMECFNDGECQSVIVQEDGLVVYKPTIPFGTKELHTEYVYWLANKKLGKTSLESIEGSTEYRMVLVQGSGAEVTMKNFATADEDYQVNLDKAIPAMDFYEAASIVADGKYEGNKVAGMLYVGKKIPAEISADFGKDVVVGEANDWDFNDTLAPSGEKMYKTCNISSENLNGMKTSTLLSPDTVCVRAVIAYQKTDNRKIDRALNKAAVKTSKYYK